MCQSAARGQAIAVPGIRSSQALRQAAGIVDAEEVGRIQRGTV